MDKLVPALDASEYGRMPATYYRHSQPVAPEPNPLLAVNEASSSLNGGSRSETNASGHDGTQSVGKELGSGKAVGDAASLQQSQTKPKPMRKPLFPRDQFDGVVDSDDETDPEDEIGGARLGEDEESEEEDRPVLVMPDGAEDALDVDMDAEEEEFLEFSRIALGISDEDWQGIIAERRERGGEQPIHWRIFPRIPPYHRVIMHLRVIQLILIGSQRSFPPRLDLVKVRRQPMMMMHTAIIPNRARPG
jgi:hypothetical protein